MPTPLTTERFGYRSNCFVCEPTNAAGLKIPFELSDDATTVLATFTLGVEHSGVPTLVHGGISLTLLDEAQAWAVIAVAGKWGLTQTTQATFSGAVFVDQVNTVRAWVTDQNEKAVRTAAVVLDAGGVEVVRSQAVFSIVGAIGDPQPALRLALERLTVDDDA